FCVGRIPRPHRGQRHFQKRTIWLMANDARLLELIGQIYDCAIEPGKWPDTLQQVVVFLGGSAAAISLQHPLKREVRLISQWGIKPDFERTMTAGIGINPLI